MYQRAIYFLLCIFMLSGCVDSEDTDYITLTKEGGSNVAAMQLLRLLEKQENGVQGLLKMTEPYKPMLDNTSLHMSSDYGMNFMVPFGDPESHYVYGMVRYPVAYEQVGRNRVSIGERLLSPTKVDADVLNNTIDIKERYLYSSYFNQLGNSTINKSDSTLTGYISLRDSVRHITDDNIPLRSSPMDFPQFYAYDHIVIDVYYDSSYIGNDPTAIYGLSPTTIMATIRQCLLNLSINEAYFDINHNYIQMLKIGIVTEFLMYYNTDWLVPYVMQQVADILYCQGFLVNFQYTCNQYLKYDSQPYPTNHGGSYTGGSSPSGGSGESSNEIESAKPYTVIENKCDSIQNADSIKAMTRALVDSCLNVIPYPGPVTNVRWKDFTDSIAKDPTIEYGTSLNDYSNDGHHLTAIDTGTSNHISFSYVDNSLTVSAIHYHPNGTPPSAHDLLELVRFGKESNKIQASMVYTRDSVFYSLQITDRSKLAAFYEKIKNEVDSTTNDFKKDGILDRVIYKNRSMLENLDKETRKIMRLSLVLKDYDAGVQIVKKDIKKTTNNVEIYSVIKNEKKYKPIKCL